MNPIYILEKNHNGIIFEIPPGKPNPRGEGNRVIQHSQKGPTCWYYAVNRIRTRVGKSADTEGTLERKVEIIGSNWRKKITELYELMPNCEDAMHMKNYALKTNSQELILNEFINIHMSLLNELGFPVELIDELTNHIKNKHRKMHAIYHIACHYLAGTYHLKKTEWTPFMEVDSLIKELTLNGPLVVEGRFGMRCYDDKPSKNKELLKGQRLTFGWRPGAKRNEIAGHVVVIVGAKITKEEELVYFIDPNERSDPQNSSSQRYFKISYKNLKSHICDSAGKLANEPTESGLHAGYGYHGNFRIET